MKEVTAIIRRQKVDITKKVLTLMGFPSMTIQSVEGRGKQLGLIQEFDPLIQETRASGDRLVATPSAYALEHSLPRSVQWVPKRMLTLVVPDEAVAKVVEGIVTINQTGHIGDGRVFVSPVADAVRIRTAERGEEAIL